MPKHPIAKLPGMGPKSEVVLADMGIADLQDFLQADPVALYSAQHKRHAGINLNMLYAMIGAQTGQPWTQVVKEQREYLLNRLDDLGIAPK